jgi:hypothetical protein
MRWIASILIVILLAATALGQATTRPVRHRRPHTRQPATLPAPPTAAQIDAAIDKAKDYLYSQLKDDNWESVPEPDPKMPAYDERGGQWGELTALSMYALLAAGESSQTPKLAPAIKWLSTTELHGTRALGIRCQAWRLMYENAPARGYAHADIELLLQNRKHPPAKSAGYFDLIPETPAQAKSTKEKPAQTQRDYYDRTASAIAILAMQASSDYEEFPQEDWKQADTAWRRDQANDGSWPASASSSSVAMTAAGITTLFITRDFILRDQLIDQPKNLRDPAIELGMNWLANHGDTIFRERGSFDSLYYIQQLGLVSGFKYIGDVNWLQRGAQEIIRSQDPLTGRFGDSTQYWRNIHDTAYGLLFLARGRAPLLMSTLRYDLVKADQSTTTGLTPAAANPAASGNTPAQPPGDSENLQENGALAGGQASGIGGTVEGNWNQRPHAIANLAHWAGQQVESELNWQIVDVNSPIAEFHDAPVLVITGDEQLTLTDIQKQKLRQFAEEGGLIFGNANRAREQFASSFIALGTELFPSYSFRALPANHPIYADQQFPAAKFDEPPDLQGLSNGCRELMLLAPKSDPVKSWNFFMTGRHKDDFRLGADIFLYCVDKQDLDARPDSYIVSPIPAIKPKRSLVVARLKYHGNWDPEPGGWRRLAAIMHNHDDLELTTQTVEFGKQPLDGFAVADLTGTDPASFGDAQCRALRNFVQNGGLLIIDNAGGTGNSAGGGFATSIEAQLSQIFGTDHANELRDILPASDPFFSAPPALLTAGYRQYARQTVGRTTQPRLRGLHINNRLAVIFSPEDLSTALVGEPVDGIIGYDPPTATLIMRKLILSALSNPPPTNANP